MNLYFILLFALPSFSEVSVAEDEIALTEDPIMPKDVEDGMTVCPFPPENAIDPCKCLMDKHLRYGFNKKKLSTRWSRITLLCDLHVDMHSYLFHQLVTSFGCMGKTIYNFHVNLNGNAWAIDFKAENFGKLKVFSIGIKLSLIFLWRSQTSNWQMPLQSPTFRWVRKCVLDNII